jgi:2-oxoglutarate ferredoxin oxidoreductase subunit beta
MQVANEHHGTSLIEVYQDCNIFNHQAWFYASQKESRADTTVMVEHGKPLTFGKDNEKGLQLNGSHIEVVNLGNGVSEDDLLVHDETDRSLAFVLSQMSYPALPEPLGVLYRETGKEAYDRIVHEQVEAARAKRGDGSLEHLLCEGETWVVDEDE